MAHAFSLVYRFFWVFGYIGGPGNNRIYQQCRGSVCSILMFMLFLGGPISFEHAEAEATDSINVKGRNQQPYFNRSHMAPLIAPTPVCELVIIRKFPFMGTWRTYIRFVLAVKKQLVKTLDSGLPLWLM